MTLPVLLWGQALFLALGECLAPFPRTLSDSSFSHLRVSPCAWTYQYSVVFLRGSLHRSQEFSLSAALSSLALYPANSRHLGLLHFQLRLVSRAVFTPGVHWAPPGFPITALWPADSHSSELGDHRTHLFLFPIPQNHSPSLSDVQCLENCCLIYFIWLFQEAIWSLLLHLCQKQKMQMNQFLFPSNKHVCMWLWFYIVHVFNRYFLKQNWS